MKTLPLPRLEDALAAFGISHSLFWVLLVALVVWSIALKGTALWYAARNHQRVWFIVLLIANTFGLLELIYLIWFRADKDENRTASLFNAPEGPESSPSV